MTGPEAIRQAAEATIGDMVVRHADVGGSARTPEERSLVQRAALIAGAVLAVVSSVKGALEVGKMIEPGLLPSPASELPPDDEP